MTTIKPSQGETIDSVIQRVESAADVGRLHGVTERVLVNEHAKSIGFYCQFLANAQGL